MDAARSLFEEYVSGDLAYLQAAVSEEREEHLRLDFKRVEKDAAPLGGGGRGCLAVALSGFANSEGGVIVWGVDCRSGGPDDSDTAKELKPIRNLKRLLTDLQADSAQLVSPGIIGVEHHPIEEPAEPGSGYAVTFVPKGESEPVMAVAKGQHTYYYRTGSVFRPMEHFQLADRFGRRPQPKLELAWKLHPERKTDAAVETCVYIGIRNVGRGLALYPALAIYYTGGIVPDDCGVDGKGNTGLPQAPQGPALDGPVAAELFAGGRDHVIHPGRTLWVTRTRGQTMPLWEPPGPQGKFIQYELYCEGFSTSGQVQIPGDDFLRLRVHVRDNPG